MRAAYVALVIISTAFACKKQGTGVSGHAKQATTPAIDVAPHPPPASLSDDKKAKAEEDWRNVVSHLKAAPISNVAIFYYLEKTNAAMGEHPKEMALYNLNQMQVVQKTTGGYLMRYNPPGTWPGGEFDYAFLRTNLELQEDQEFLDFMHWSVSNGVYQYVANNGFKREILSFVMLPDRANAVVNERLGRR